MRIGVSLNDRVGEVADTVAYAARIFELAAKLKPQERCDGIGQLLALTDEFDRDPQDHIRLENDVLLPRAIEAERTVSKRR